MVNFDTLCKISAIYLPYLSFSGKTLKRVDVDVLACLYSAVLFAESQLNSDKAAPLMTRE